MTALTIALIVESILFAILVIAFIKLMQRWTDVLIAEKAPVYRSMQTHVANQNAEIDFAAAEVDDEGDYPEGTN